MLRIGALGVLGLGLDGYLRSSHALGAPPGKPLLDRHVIFIRLAGGPSHLDTFDPKPEARAEVRGSFGVIKTNTGERLSAQLPSLARSADKYAIVRSMSHNLGEHSLAGILSMTGQRPDPALTYPDYGAVAAKEAPSPATMPSFVAIPRGGSAGYLGVVYAPFATGDDPADANFAVRGLSLPKDVTVERLRRRRQLALGFDPMYGPGEPVPDVVRGLDRFQQQALAIVTSTQARDAFDLRKEPDAVRDAYGRTRFGQSLLLARRLIEADVRFVNVSSSLLWDTHEDNFKQLETHILPSFDQGLAALLEDLARTGRLATTIVIAIGEFGRTPLINDKAGRDHWPYVYSALLAGGGIAGGRIVGRSDADGGAPAERPVSPQDIAFTLFTLLGIDPHKRYSTPTGRSVAVVHDGSLVRELLG
jgi:hypothetical protein